MKRRERLLRGGAQRRARVPGSAAASHTGTPIVSAWLSTRDSDVCPSPRRGELAIRVNALASCGLTRNVR